MFIQSLFHSAFQRIQRTIIQPHLSEDESFKSSYNYMMLLGITSPRSRGDRISTATTQNPVWLNSNHQTSSHLLYSLCSQIEFPFWEQKKHLKKKETFHSCFLPAFQTSQGFSSSLKYIYNPSHSTIIRPIDF